MLDSVLKGTGNSRFLKSAVPAGTSWADALAMLQAGTFPIDLNGINAAGFQQVGTPLNKANLLKDATAAQIGLPPSTTPDGMFQALGNTGELHVWRKTTVTPAGTTTTYPVSTNPNAYQEGDDAKPAGYVLGDAVSGVVVSSNTGAGSGGFHWASALTVTDDGAISLDTSANSGTLSGGITYFKDWLSSNARGHFCKFYLASGSTSDYTFLDGLYYFPEDTVFSTTNISGDRVTGFPATVSASKMQKVTGYPAIPAGTTIEYLGKLGDKARVQVVSYVGTGTSGSDNPVSITFNFVPKSIWVIGQGYNYESEIHLMHGDASKNSGEDYYFSFSRISWESETVSWYNTRDDNYQASALQANILGETYKVLAIG